MLTSCYFFRFFERIDRVLRRAVGVSEHAPTDTTVNPAPEPESEEPAKDETTKKLASELDHDVVVDEHLFDGPQEKLPEGFQLGVDDIPEPQIVVREAPEPVADDAEEVKDEVEVDVKEDEKAPHDEL